MKITIEELKDGGEEEIIIRTNTMDEQLLQLIYNVKMKSLRITGTRQERLYVIAPKDIYYIESVDNKAFIYTKDSVYESKQKLYEFEEQFKNTDFFRASKSVILNRNKIKSLSPAFNGRLEALLQNGEKVIISRQYVAVLKRMLLL
ncbi:MAG: LytTR family DNA-binding domain-containing protein [bacterium]|nr:LytTR family DNA-binding domain-containing protein [bacterium]